MNHCQFPSLQHNQKAGSKDKIARDGQGIGGWIVPLPRSPGGEISTRGKNLGPTWVPLLPNTVQNRYTRRRKKLDEPTR